MKKASSKLNTPVFGFAASAVIFALLNIIFKNIQFFPNYADFRISAFFPVTAGLLFGPWGALGCAAGNLIADFFGTLNYESSLGMLANFLFAWLPYRLWHTIFPFENHRVQYISSTKTLVKYILITSFSVMSSMAVLAAGCDLLGAFDFSEFFKPVFTCNLYFALFWGTTVFLLASKLLPVTPYIPKKLYSYEYCGKRYIPDCLLCAAVSAAVLIRYIAAESSQGAAPALLDLVILGGTLILAFLPLRRSGKPRNESIDAVTKNTGLQAQIITGFFIAISVSTTFLVLLIIFELFSFDSDSRYISQLIQYAFKTVNLFGFAFIFVLIIVLIWIENRIAKPVIKLAEFSGRFVENGLRGEIPDYSKLSDEISVLEQSCRKMSSDIESYVNMIEAQAKREEKTRLTLETAAKIQMGMLPEPLEDSRFSLAAFINPARTVGGDFYYYTKLDGDRLLACIADVSSKGMPAAMFMAEASMLVKCNRELPPNEILANVNNALCENNRENMFVTMFAGIIDLGRKKFEFANAGHNYPIIRSKNGVRWLKSQPETALGLFPDKVYSLNSIDIDGDFQLLLYTDGVVESENTEGVFFGNERLEKLCNTLNSQGGSARDLLDKIIKQVEEFSQGAEQSDDITALIVNAGRNEK